MTNSTLTPRPTRSTLRNRRIVMDLSASINGSLVGENGLKSPARRADLPQSTDKPTLVIQIATVALIGLGILALLAL